MRISGTEPSSVILSQTLESSIKKVGKCCQKSAETSWSQKGWCNNPQNYNSNQFKHGKFLCSPNATNQPK